MSPAATLERISVPFLDLSVKDPDLKAELLQAVDRVLTHGRLVLGPEVQEFEARVAEAAQKQFAVGMGSGTDALYLALRSLDLGPGDEVITTALSWIATTNAMTLCGATPVWVDIGSDLNIDPARIEAAITPRTRAIVAVHFTGTLCDMDAILEIARRHGLMVVEDAAQAFTASVNGRNAGSFGRVSAFSMNPMKVFGAYGEAGAVATDDPELHEKLVSLRYNGTINREDCRYPSINGRLDTLQAAMLLVNLKRLPER
ncbi:MAG TPA: DegT/DnrJ/EryC1/StrS family aminotransferase, partial [Chloroflexota bacterium]